MMATLSGAMKRSTLRAQFALFLSMVPVAMMGCAGRGAPARVAAKSGWSPPPDDPIFRLMPLHDNFVFAYDSEARPSGDKGAFFTRVRALGGARFELVTAGSSRLVEFDPGGFKRSDSGVYVLHVPIVDGGTCPGALGGSVRIVDIHREITTPAGRFRECVQTREAGRSDGHVVEMTFCPGVGIVRLEGTAGPTASEIAQLRSFGPAVDLQHLP